MGKLAKQLSGQADVKVFAKGGKVHSDEAQDKVLIKKMMAAEEKAEKKACGGKVKRK